VASEPNADALLQPDPANAQATALFMLPATTRAQNRAHRAHLPVPQPHSHSLTYRDANIAWTSVQEYTLTLAIYGKRRMVSAFWLPHKRELAECPIDN
jgi:hypothetical protein